MQVITASGVRLLAVLALVLATAMTPGASGAGRLVGPTWRAEDIRGGGVIDGAQSTVAFDAGGKMTGSGGCNRLFATATVVGDALTIGVIGTTRKACAPALMTQELTFLDALAATRTFGFQGPYLKFYDGSGGELIRFTELR